VHSVILYLRFSRWKVDQVLQLCSITEDDFQPKQKTAVALVDLTAAYDTVWHQGLGLKVLRTVPDKHMVAFIMDRVARLAFLRPNSRNVAFFEVVWHEKLVFDMYVIV